MDREKPMPMTAAEIERLVRAHEHQRKELGDRSFALWMGRPETKLVISLLPPAQPPEALQTLLRSAFDGGFNGGEGFAIVAIIDSMVGARR
jgi:hypothetical protein